MATLVVRVARLGQELVLIVRAAYAQKGDQDMGGGDPRPIFGTDPGGRPGNVVASSRRDELRDDLVAAGMVRPQRSTYGR